MLLTALILSSHTNLLHASNDNGSNLHASDLVIAHKSGKVAASKMENKADKSALLGKEYGGFEYPHPAFIQNYKGPIYTSLYGSGFVRNHFIYAFDKRMTSSDILRLAETFLNEKNNDLEWLELTAHTYFAASMRRMKEWERQPVGERGKPGFKDPHVINPMFVRALEKLARAYEASELPHAAYVYRKAAAGRGSHISKIFITEYMKSAIERGEKIPWWEANKQTNMRDDRRKLLYETSRCSNAEMESNSPPIVKNCLYTLREFLQLSETLINEAASNFNRGGSQNEVLKWKSRYEGFVKTYNEQEAHIKRLKQLQQ